MSKSKKKRSTKNGKQSLLEKVVHQLIKLISTRNKTSISINYMENSGFRIRNDYFNFLFSSIYNCLYFILTLEPNLFQNWNICQIVSDSKYCSSWRQIQIIYFKKRILILIFKWILIDSIWYKKLTFTLSLIIQNL